MPERDPVTKPVTLLVVDDTEANRYAVARHLRSQGFAVREAATGAEGLLCARTELPDLVVLDIRLPDMTGYDVARAIRTDERTADIPILHISASFTDPESKARGLDNGADGYLTHPVDPPVMLATVRALLRARTAERAAMATARDWRATFDAIGEGVCVTDVHGNVTRCNRAFRRLVGMADEGGGSVRLARLVPGIEVTAEAPFVRLPGNGEAARIELAGRWLRVSAVPVIDADGDPDGAVCVLTDVTRERRADERVRQALQLESTGRLAGGVAHEINNMMTAILAHAEFALRALGPADAARADIEGIHQAATRSAHVARQLLTFSRRQVINPEVVDAHALIRAAEPTIHRLLGADRKLRVELGARGAWVAVDTVGLEQILINLALNARDAMPRGGELSIRTSDAVLDEAFAQQYPEITIRQGNYFQIEVRDTGLGMDPDTLARVFEPFFTTKDVGEGTGLGLATVFGMVKQSNGYIWAASEVGKGATFTVQLPRVAPREPPPPPPFTGEHPAVSGRALVVEDERIVLTLISRTLAEAGYLVEHAADGREALEVLERLDGQVAVVISDVVMPQMGGRELARHIRERWPSIPILFMSGYTSEEVVGQGLVAQHEAFMQKPFPPGALARAVRELVGRATS
jgi:hypothetical protein